ncbi:MAG: glycosyltransferase family 4 protein [Elainella sp. Prado103]|jgi:hypothetical protein|nr:glycosyltransferase family 4 protein [Elainella sp. Prado103]
MKYHIALSRPFNLKKFHEDAQLDQCPRHTMWTMSQELNATVHQPDVESVQWIDRAMAKMISQPEHWALARALAHKLTANDTVFCTGEDIGFPLAILTRFQTNRPRITVSVMEPNRIRVRAMSQFFQLAQSIDLFITNTQIKADTLRRRLNLPASQVYVLREQTDVQFFCPGPVTPGKERPIIASAGLEQRDYVTLAAATEDLDVDVKICAVSPNASAKTRVAFPEVMPKNMSSHPQEWRQFRQLYRNADLVVVSLLYNTYSAGLTTLMEAMACRRPVIITRTPGLAERLIDLGVVVGVAPGDAAGMKQAIQHFLQNPQLAEAQAQKGYEYLLQEHTSERHLEDLIAQIKRVSGVSPQPMQEPELPALPPILSEPG